MKKLLSILTISAILISGSVYLSNTTTTVNQTNSIILHVQQSVYDTNTNLYIDKVADENGDLYIIKSTDNISNQWLDATITNQGAITNYKIMS